MKQHFKPNWGISFSLVLLVSLFIGCVAAIPIVVNYLATDDGYVATADSKMNADKIWQAVTRIAEKREAEGRIEILEREDSMRFLKVTDKKQTANIEVLSKKAGGSRLVVKTDVPSESKEEELKKEEELAKRITLALCEEAKTKCRFVEE